MIVHKILPELWKELATDTHRIVFGEEPPPSQAKMDYALVVQDPRKDEYVTYVTVRELDPETAYWGYGGAFPAYKNTLAAYRAYQAVTEFTFKSGIKSIFTLIENTNVSMLKFALKIGYKIIGVRHVNGCTMLEHLLESPVK